MDSALIAILILFLLGVIGFVYSRRIKREAKKIGANFHALCNHLHGLPDINDKAPGKLFFTDEKIIAKISNKTYDLIYEQITAVAYANKSDFLKKDRSVIGRGIAGGILLGPVGAIIGGMSAIGRQKNIKGEFLIIDYIPSTNDEQKTIIFDLYKPSIARKAEKFIVEKCPQLVKSDHVVI